MNLKQFQYLVLPTIKLQLIFTFIWALGNVFEMFPVADNKFFIAREGAPTYEFLKDNAGRIASVRREWNGGTSTGQRSLLPKANSSGNTTLELKGYEMR